MSYKTYKLGGTLLNLACTFTFCTNDLRYVFEGNVTNPVLTLISFFSLLIMWFLVLTAKREDVEETDTDIKR